VLKLLKVIDPGVSVRVIQQSASLKSFPQAACKIRASPLRNALITRITAPDTTQTRNIFYHSFSQNSLPRKQKNSEGKQIKSIIKAT